VIKSGGSTLPATGSKVLDANQIPGGTFPTMIAFDASDNLYVAGFDSKIYVLPAGSPAGTMLTEYADFPATQLTGMVVIGSTLYLSGFNAGSVYSLPTGRTSGLPLTASTFASGLAAPGVLGLGTDGTSLYVADDNNFNGGTVSGIYKLDPAGGPYSAPALWVDTTSEAGIVPVNVTGDHAGNVYMTSYNGQLLKVAAGSSTATVIEPSLVAHDLWAVLAVGDKLYVTGPESPSANDLSVLQIGGVVPPTTTTSPPTTSSVTTTTSPGLPATGASSSVLGGLGIMLIGAGALLTRRIRRA
jgi:LPXTG-motif cell wall-anchored protein